MQAFVWNDRFATGIESVDGQHQHLMEIVNQVGDLLIGGETVPETALQAIFKKLADYTRFHFTDEERIMTEAALDPRHIADHKKLHHAFTEHVISMWNTRNNMADPAETLHGFLTSWLTYHILGEDQAMAREMQRIAAGMSAAEAYAQETAHGERSTSALLGALHNLYGVLSQQNRALANTNQQLESRVAERTTELKAAYTQLEADHQRVSALLEQVTQAQNRLLQSEKMAAVGQLAAGVAHEINNPIGFVYSNFTTLGKYVSLLLQVVDAADSPAAQKIAAEIDLPYLRQDIGELIKESSDGLQRVRKIVADLKDFSHIDETLPQATDLLAGLEATINVASHEIKGKATLQRELQPLPPVRCVGGQINLVLMNLLVNAAQSIKETGTITLRSGVDGDKVWLEVDDTGCGMSEEVKRRIFVPFYTTKPVGTGTGLGMSLSYDIINAHGGHFDIHSTLGKGTRMRLWLPIAGPVAASQSIQQSDSP